MAQKLADFLHSISKSAMGSKMTSAIEQPVDIFTNLVTIINLHQRVSTLMDMKGKMLLHTDLRYFFRNGSSLWIT
jgi:hypothetical protein